MLVDQVITLAGLCSIGLPDRTVRLCDGAFVAWGVDLFTAQDDDFGTIESIDAVAEAISDEAPSGKMTMLPPSVTEAAALFLPSAQGSPMQFWLAEIDPATGGVVGDPDLLFSGFLDTLTLQVGKDRRAVDIEFMSEAERLFWTKEGNVLSQRFHNLAWPGEGGFQFATSVPALVAWGVPGPGRGTVGSSGSMSAGSGGFSQPSMDKL
jgi:hypothetical protein